MKRTYILVIKESNWDFKELLGVPLLYYHFLRARKLNSSLFLISDSKRHIDYLKALQLADSINGKCYITFSNCFDDEIEFNIDSNLALEKIKNKEIKESGFTIRSNRDFYELTNKIRNCINLKWIDNNVEIENIQTTYIGPEVTIGKETKITGDTHILGQSVIGENNIINSCHLDNVSIGNENELFNSHLVGSTMGNKNKIGPYCRMRGKTNISNECVIGNFVEIKSSNIKDHVKIKHLSYIGDTFIEKNVNIGCGFATANYDGKNKYSTTIKENAFIGCDTTIVSPVTINKDSYIAAGSVITNDVETGDLAIARSRQINKSNYTKQKK